jgi:hypothetical protein
VRHHGPGLPAKRGVHACGPTAQRGLVVANVKTLRGGLRGAHDAGES